MPEANRRQAASDTPETQAMRGQLGRILQTAVDELPETYRSVFVLREVEQLNTAGDSRVPWIKRGQTRLHRSRALLRRELEEPRRPGNHGRLFVYGTRCDRTVIRVLERIEARDSG